MSAFTIKQKTSDVFLIKRNNHDMATINKHVLLDMQTREGMAKHVAQAVAAELNLSSEEINSLEAALKKCASTVG